MPPIAASTPPESDRSVDSGPIPVLARQPIFNRNRKVVAYELLYRGPEDADGSAATARVMVEALASIDFAGLSPATQLFINMPRDALDWSFEATIPPARLVLEILETVVPEPALIAAVEKHKAAGYKIALDDFEWSPRHASILKLADYVKLDVLAHADRLADVVRLVRRPGLQLLAEKVETVEQQKACEALGFDLFQGYVFCRPELVGRGPLPGPSFVLCDLMSRLRDPDVSHATLAQLIRRDVTIAYQIVRLANSPLNGVARVIRSVEDALVVVGADAIRNWASILILARLAMNKPVELLEMAIARGVMCVRLGELHGLREVQTLYTVGLFSVLDALLDREMEHVIGGLSLADGAAEALVGHAGAFGDVLSAVIDFEQGRWDRLALEIGEPAMRALGDAQAAGLAEGRIAFSAN